MKKINSAKIKIIHPGVGTDPVPINIDYSAAMEEAFCSFLGRGLKKFKFVCGGGKIFWKTEGFAVFCNCSINTGWKK